MTLDPGYGIGFFRISDPTSQTHIFDTVAYDSFMPSTKKDPLAFCPHFKVRYEDLSEYVLPVTKNNLALRQIARPNSLRQIRKAKFFAGDNLQVTTALLKNVSRFSMTKEVTEL